VPGQFTVLSRTFGSLVEGFTNMVAFPSMMTDSPRGVQEKSFRQKPSRVHGELDMCKITATPLDAI
jgi:hypothetical protein